MTTEEEVQEEEGLEAFLPRLEDEIAWIQQKQTYARVAQAFTHWAIRQISQGKNEEQVREIVLAGKPTHVTWKQGGQTYFVSCHWGMGEKAPVEPAIHQFGKQLSTFLDAGDGIRPETGAPVRALLVWGEEIGPHVRTAAETLFAENYTKTRADFDILDLHQLYDQFLLRLETADLPVPNKCTLGVRRNFTHVTSTPGRAIILEVPLLEIYNLVREFQLALFAKNLRVPISGSKYNRGIKRVLEDAEERRNFWYYNNGLTAVCTDFKIRDDEGGSGASIDINQVQIVNGCQTSMTIYNEGARLAADNKPLSALSEATVLMRLIQVHGTDREKAVLTQQISRYTNSQTPITGRDLRATDPEQARFREECNREWKLFLETKRDEWKRRVEVNKAFKQSFQAPFNLSNEKVGQHFLATWQQRPGFAKSHKKAIFEDDGVYRSVFGMRVATEALLVPSFLAFNADDWRKKRGYVKRHTGPGTTHRISKNEVVKHGELYLLACIGKSLLHLNQVTNIRDFPVKKLRAYAYNLRLTDERYGGDQQGSTKRLGKTLQAAFDQALDLLYAHVVEICDRNPDINVRNLMVRETMWTDFYAKNPDPVNELAAPLLPILGKATDNVTGE